MKIPNTFYFQFFCIKDTFFFKKMDFIFIYVYLVWWWWCVCELSCSSCVCLPKPKEGVGSPEDDYKVVVGCLVWVLRTKLCKGSKYC